MTVLIKSGIEVVADHAQWSIIGSNKATTKQMFKIL